jgi:ketosteroid isomerase-like protein
MTEPTAVVGAFNDAINRRDLDALAALMTDDHRFTDATGGHVDAKAACVDAWRGFFTSFPDYRNVFVDVVHEGGGVVAIHGRSTCSAPELDGPARWRAVVVDGRVASWHVTDVGDDTTPD